MSFYYPSPVFQGYDHLQPQVFPIIAIIKFLISEVRTKQKNYVSINEIQDFLMANNVTGSESLNFYATLTPNACHADIRQTRELVRFISQLSFLKWDHPTLHLELTDNQDLSQMNSLLKPNPKTRLSQANHELVELGKNFQKESLENLTIGKINVLDSEFTEGSKIRATHLRTERSAKLKEIYFARAQFPHTCDMCRINTLEQYPWVERLIEIHHLLPLSSPVQVGARTTSIKDVVGLCPSCHRATHRYYNKWLKDHNLKDFRNYDEARNTYGEARHSIVI